MQFGAENNEFNLSSFETIQVLKVIHKQELEMEHIEVRHKLTGQVYLLKKIIKPRNPRILEGIVKEYNLLKELNHPNIIKAYSSKETDNELYLLYQLAQRDLNDQFRTTSEQQSAMIILQVAGALEYLHSQSILHRYVNLSTIMVSGSGMDIKAKLTDFSHMGSIMSSGSIQCQSIDSLAPEILENKIQNEKADVWGLGIAMYMLYCKSHPFSGKGKMSLDFVRESIRKCIVVYPQTLLSTIRQLLQKIFLSSPLLRFTITQIISHEYFAEFREKLEQTREKEHLQQRANDLQRQLQYVKSNEFKSKEIRQLQEKLRGLESQYRSALQTHDFQRHKLKETEVKCLKVENQKRTVQQYRMNLEKSKLQLSKINNNIILIVEENKKIELRTKELETELNFLKAKSKDKERSRSNKSSSSIGKYIVSEKLKEFKRPKNLSKGRIPPMNHSKNSRILY